MVTSTNKKAVALLLGVLMLSSCAAYDGYFYGGTYDGYYDNFYGPYISGYWASDGLFWYRGGDHIYHRDDGSHFRRQRFTGGVQIRGERGWTRNHPPPGAPTGPRPGRPPGH
jgi:hypothetical protein